ncbi:hypothetical protein L227DRAFT_575958 [Lentinus tigrinus ALCF2SS1-6]|uniref:Uncharacterized protein n=1 Tax=Lentinus tigrinus ALCF2SS1-6 TaxID=1328759 RepID=A0A5C2S9P4_9APHY|nr:hypothetical protein L227DRAFT_575958 [Lentinus tigrinus ALCF2SS1-6]
MEGPQGPPPPLPMHIAQAMPPEFGAHGFARSSMLISIVSVFLRRRAANTTRGQ